MGTWINMNNHIHIANEHLENGILQFYSYKEVDDAFIEAIKSDEKLVQVQIDSALPEEGYQAIDRILAARPDLYFRIFGLYEEQSFDISFLERMPHMHKLWIDCHLRANPNLIDFSILPKLQLTGLWLHCFDLPDYGFIKDLSEDLKELDIQAETSGKSIRFDCEWLLRFQKLNTLRLGKKAKKHLEVIARLPELKSLSLRGIKLTDFTFLKELQLESLALLWNSNNDLHKLADLKGLKAIELWRINKLDNIDFMSNLENLEVIKLQDLKHITVLPDLTKLRNLRKICLIDTGIKDIPEEYKPLLCRW